MLICNKLKYKSACMFLFEGKNIRYSNNVKFGLEYVIEVINQPLIQYCSLALNIKLFTNVELLI